MKGEVCEGVLRQFKDYMGAESAPEVVPGPLGKHRQLEALQAL